MTDHPEFSRPLRVDRVPSTGCTEVIGAEGSECSALAQRFGLAALHSLSAQITAEPARGKGLKLTAQISAEIEQVCVVTLENFNSTIRWDVERIYLPPGSPGADSDEAEIDVINGDSIDLGEFVAEELGLVLDPYPRKPDATFEGVQLAQNEESSPFGSLALLKPKS